MASPLQIGNMKAKKMVSENVSFVQSIRKNYAHIIPIGLFMATILKIVKGGVWGLFSAN